MNKIKFIPAPHDLKEKYRNEYRKEDETTPYRMTVFPAKDMPFVVKFKTKNSALEAFNLTDGTRLLQSFIGGKVSFLGYKRVL